MTESEIKQVWANDHPYRTWVSEIGLSNHNSRVDILGFQEKDLDLVIGVEIKTQTDNLKRLKDQMRSMSELFDDCHLVVAPKHLEKADAIIPPWWGLWIADQGKITLARAATQRTFFFDKTVIAEQLWVDELKTLLSQHQRPAHAKARKPELCRMASRLPRKVLLTAWLTSTHFQEAVKARGIR